MNKRTNNKSMNQTPQMSEQEMEQLRMKFYNEEVERASKYNESLLEDQFFSELVKPTEGYLLVKLYMYPAGSADVRSQLYITEEGSDRRPKVTRIPSPHPFMTIGIVKAGNSYGFETNEIVQIKREAMDRMDRNMATGQIVPEFQYTHPSFEEQSYGYMLFPVSMIQNKLTKFEI